MPEEVIVSSCKQYICIRSTGLIDVNEFKYAINKTVVLSNEFNVYKVMVDSRGRRQLPNSSESLDAGNFLAEATRGRLKFAILVDSKLSHHEFFECATEFKGGVIAYFNDELSAIEWLNED